MLRDVLTKMGWTKESGPPESKVLQSQPINPTVTNFGGPSLEVVPQSSTDFSSILDQVIENSKKDKPGYVQFMKAVPQMFVQTTINGNVELTINLNSNDANAVQNRIKQEITDLKIEEILKETYERVALKLYQARSDIKSKTGNKGIIEEINEKPLNIIFDNDDTKEQILQSEINPLKSIFIVDVKIINVDQKPTIYKILKLHESFEIE